jgi:hypothetical protein
MSKECVICGRPIRTGKKYCWEHRHAAQAEDVRGEQLIQKATRGYRRYKLGRFWVFIYNERRFLIYVILGISFISMFILRIYTILFVSLLLFLLAILELISVIKMKIINKEIENRSPDYVEFVRSRADDDKDERKFKKYLVRGE